MPGAEGELPLVSTNPFDEGYAQLDIDADDATEDASTGADKDSASVTPAKTFRGLSNQGATCYMNSLLQSLYMTPEFREVIHKWRHDPERDGPKQDCIAYQLQTLFTKLQCSTRSAIETKDLTRSFGWTSSDSFVQHDVQELNRVLFEALEKTFADTDLKTILNDLYEGKMIDGIKCKVCGYHSARTDMFLDISLVINDVNSLQQALDKFVEQELMDGDNQYFCEKCDGKVDAEKGFQLTELPYIMSIQLKRFGYDWEYNRRIKLNHEVRFPLYLDMRPFLQGDDQGDDDDSKDASNKPSDSEAGEERDGVDDVADGLASIGLSATSIKDASNTQTAQSSTPAAEFTKPEDWDSADHQYELFSVLIHSGSALGGHYYAYIKDLTTSDWYKFNDSTVTPVDQSILEETFGNKNESSAGRFAYGRSANAYMLVYRRRDTERNITTSPSKDLLNAELVQDIEADNKAAIEQEAAWRRRQNEVHLRVYHEPGSERQDTTIVVQSTDTIADVVDTVYVKFGYEKDVKRDNFRLRAYTPTTKIAGDPYVKVQDKTLKQTPRFSRTLLVETRQDGQEWPVFDPNLTLLRLVTLNEEANEYNDPISVFVPRHATLSAVHDEAGRILNCPPNEVRIFELLETAHELDNPGKKIDKYYRLGPGDTLHVEHCPGTSPGDPSKIKDKFHHDRNFIRINFNAIDDTEPRQMHHVIVNRQEPLSSLKAAIAEVLEIGADEFRIFDTGISKHEYQDTSQSCLKWRFRDGDTVLVKVGKPLTPGEFELCVVEYTPPDLSDDATKYQGFITKKFKRVFHENDKISSVKEVIAEKLGVEKDLIRLRDMMNRRVTSIISGDCSLVEGLGPLYEGRELCVQLLDEPETVSKKVLTINLQQWHPATATIGSKRIEHMFATDATLADAGKVASELFDIPFEHVALYRPYIIMNKVDIDFLTRAVFASPKESEDDSPQLTQSPLYLHDGTIVLCKDAREADKEPAEDQKGSSGSAIVAAGPVKSVSMGPSRSGVRGVRRKEPSLKIKTFYDKKDDAAKGTDDGSGSDLAIEGTTVTGTYPMAPPADFTNEFVEAAMAAMDDDVSDDDVPPLSVSPVCGAAPGSGDGAQQADTMASLQAWSEDQQSLQDDSQVE